MKERKTGKLKGEREGGRGQRSVRGKGGREHSHGSLDLR